MAARWTVSTPLMLDTMSIVAFQVRAAGVWLGLLFLLAGRYPENSFA